MQHVKTDQLPGIGQKFTFQITSGDTITIVILLDGEREIYQTRKHETTPKLLLELTDEESHAVATILTGAYFPSTPNK